MRQRESYFDNAKVILMFFVVFGHILRTYIDQNETIYALYTTIYTFHMPAFILLSGFFAKGFNKKGYIKKLSTKLILPYLLFQVIYTIYYYYLFDKSTLKFEALEPNWSLWFLLSLFFWNLMLFVFTKFKPLVGIGLAIPLALLVGYIDTISTYLSLSRTFVFFPFFLIGYHSQKEHFQKITTVKSKFYALASFGVIFIWFSFFPEIDSQWLLGSKPYSEIETVSFLSMFKRLGFFIVNSLMIVSFMALVPRGSYFFTRWGTQTLYVYLLHGFFVRTFRFTSLNEYFTTAEHYILLAAISLIITIILSSTLVKSITQPMIEFNTRHTKMMFYKLKGLLHFYKQKYDLSKSMNRSPSE
ncbi:acyltransferase family protein [Bacillus sp. FJAT-27986]|uniref:acyltransferase family protein n=1 Tax=Bacillus sp. FJAT-27986 TaxID=1743146 RepID=UPI00080AE61C|nr:acyltransferase family protein [Bacillus sp. FJAT-27986]OCA89801.1 acyltransferase [Bacillus sp. FJAT-27986]